METIPLPYGSKNPYRNLKSENSQEYAQKPQRNCMFMYCIWFCTVRTLMIFGIDEPLHRNDILKKLLTNSRSH
jgi:hypothetical protein